MREAIGGTMLFWIVLTFVAIFIGFMAAVAQYAKIYRIKNAMINYIEQGEGISTTDHVTDFEKKLKDLGYGSVNPNPYILCRDVLGGSISSTREGSYYFLVLYVRFQIPYASSIKLPITGDTRLVETGTRINVNDINWIDFPEYGKTCITNE
jgi:hypothetical protein